MRSNCFEHTHDAPCSSVVTTCIRQSLRTLEPFHHCIASVPHTLVLFALSVSFLAVHHHLVVSICTLLLRTYLTAAAITCKGCYSENSRSKKKKLLDEGGCCLTSLAFDSWLLLFLLFLARKRLHYQIANFLGGGGYHFVCLFLLFSLSLSHFLHTQSRPIGCITQ